MRYLLMLFALSLALALAGCERGDAPEPPAEPQSTAPEPAEPMADGPEGKGSPEAAEPGAPMDGMDTGTPSEAEQLWNRATELAEQARDRAEEAWRVGQEEGSEAWERAKETAAMARDRAEQAWDRAREFSGEAGDAAQTRTEAVWDDIKATWARMTQESGEPETDEGPAASDTPAE